MARQENFDAHFGGPLHDRIEIVYLEPKQHAVPVWLVLRIANSPVIVLHLEIVELKNQLPIRYQLLICGAPVIAAAAEQALIPPAARFHIADRD